jgi:hypothetical protein
MFTRRFVIKAQFGTTIAALGAIVLPLCNPTAPSKKTHRKTISTDEKFIRWWADQAEFTSKYYTGYGAFYGTSRDLGGIYRYITEHIESFQDVPRGWHVIDRNYHEDDHRRFNVQFAKNLPHEATDDAIDRWRLHIHLAMEDWILAHPDKLAPPAAVIAAWFATPHTCLDTKLTISSKG